MPLASLPAIEDYVRKPFESMPLATNVYDRSPSGRCPGSLASARTAPCACRDVAYDPRFCLCRAAQARFAPPPGLAAPLLLATEDYARQPFGSMPGFSSQRPHSALRLPRRRLCLCPAAWARRATLLATEDYARQPFGPALPIPGSSPLRRPKLFLCEFLCTVRLWHSICLNPQA